MFNFRGIYTFDTLAEFPDEGIEQYYYVDLSTEKIYTFASGVYTERFTGSGFVASVLGTTDRITSTGGLNPVIDLSSVLENKLKNIHTSGVVSGGVVTINANPSLIDISAGTGFIVDYSTTPGVPTLIPVTWTAQIGVSVTYLATNTISYVGISITGAVTQYNDVPSNEDRRDALIFAQLGHTSLTSVASVIDYCSAYGSPFESTRDLIAQLNLINEGNLLSANGANLKINKASGFLFGLGINFRTNFKNPNKKAIASATAPTFKYRTQTGLGASTSDIAPDSYDLAGAITTIGGSTNRSTNQRVYLFPNGSIVIQYGQVIYNTLQEAIQGVQTEVFVPFSNVREGAILIGIISLRRTTTALNDITFARFLLVSKFGENIVGGAGISTTSLQQAYNNSVTPEIITNSTLGAVSVQRGSAADTDNIYEGKNGAGTTTYSVDGNGLIKGNSSLLTNLLKKQNTTISHTGTTAPTIITSFEILAGTIEANDFLDFQGAINCTNNANNKNWKLWLNTTNNLSGSPVQIMTRTLTTSTGGLIKRNLAFNNSLSSQKIYDPTSNVATDEGANSAQSALTVNFAVTQYLIIEFTLGSSLDTMSLQWFKLKLDR